MKTQGIIKKGEYFDSVSIMLVAKQLAAVAGIIDSASVMGTDENKATLQEAGMLLPEFSDATEMDLLIVFKTEDAVDAKKIFAQIETFLKAKTNDSVGTNFQPASVDEAVKYLSGANLALISVAGRYAGDVAQKALDNGLHVMLFSDNVSIEKEIALKEYAAQKELFVMGPDCGTAIINGVPLAFANVVKRGNIGIVAASGTGCQEVSCIISNFGGGVSQAIGTGGRDVKKQVGGIMFLQGISALAADSETEVILLVSKPPAPEVIEKVKELTAKISKPVVGVFLGSPVALLKGSKIVAAETLEEGALLSVALAGKQGASNVHEKLSVRAKEILGIAAKEQTKLNANQKYLRALFSGGTFCDETQLLCRDSVKELYSNTPISGVNQLKDAWKSEKNTIVDLGDDEFTVGKPHPMIDYSTRNKRIIAEAQDPETAVILLDIVLGYGANMDPLSEIIPVLKEVKQITQKENRVIPIIASVTGTESDPQNRDVVVTALQAEGAMVMESNAAASRLATAIIAGRN
jgi:succinyl-CoA synthetase alpha subunit